MTGRRAAIAVTTLAVLLAAGAPLQAQRGSSRVTSPAEARMLREAAALESRGSFRAAEARLRDLLGRHPASAAAVFALERVLRAQDRVEGVLPVADEYLSRDARGRAVRFLKLRVLAEVDSLGGLEEAVAEWIEAAPGSLDPYREGARIYEDAYGPGRALDLLEEGRRRVGRPHALAVEVGDLRARTGDAEGAVAEWSRAIGREGANLSAILRRLRDLDGDPRALSASLVDHLAREPTTGDRMRAAVRVAVDAGLSERALALGERVTSRLDGTSGRGFLVDVARRAEEGGRTRVALWAYERLREGAGTTAEARALDLEIVDAALAHGDTTRAAEAQARIVESRLGGSQDRRRALARLVRLRAAVGEPDAVLRDLRAFRDEFPKAPETDLLAATVARRLLARDQTERAAAVLDGVEGARSALERGMLALQRGEVQASLQELEAAAEGLDPERATAVVSLVTLVGGLSPEGRPLAARAAVLAHRGRTPEAVRTVEDELRSVPLDDRPGLLALGARLADGSGDPGAAARFRRRLVDDFPGAPETPEAVVRLARHRARTPEGRERAAELLEQLILNRPESAVVPEARRELERLRSRVPGRSGGGSP